MKNLFKSLSRLMIISIIGLPAIGIAQIESEEELEPWYQFEMLIFAYDQPETQETLRKNPFDLDEIEDDSIAEYSLNELYQPPEDGVTLISNDESEETESPEIPALLPVQNGEPMLLAKYAEMLKYRRAYKVMWHKAWQQPLPPNSEIRKYTLRTGKLITQKPKPKPEELNDTVNLTSSADEEALDALISQFSDQTDNNLGFALDTQAIPIEPTPYQLAKDELALQAPHRRQLQGSVNVYRKSFAHIEFDLWFAEIDPYIAPINVKLMKETWPVEGDTPIEENTLDVSDTIVPTDSETKLEENLETIALLEPEFEVYTEEAYTANRFGHINEDRRIRSTELYYVDHPLFGIVLKMEKVVHPLEREDVTPP